MAQKRPDPRETLAATLKMLMRKTQLSEQDVAKRSGISKKSVNNMLNGRHAPNLDHVDAVARVFDLDLWQIIRPNLPEELMASGRLDRLIERYVAADERGRDSIDRVAEIAADSPARKM